MSKRKALLLQGISIAHCYSLICERLGINCKTEWCSCLIHACITLPYCLFNIKLDIPFFTQIHIKIARNLRQAIFIDQRKNSCFQRSHTRMKLHDYATWTLRIICIGFTKKSQGPSIRSGRRFDYMRKIPFIFFLIEVFKAVILS